MKTFRTFVESPVKRIGVFPGAFKPPHKGHFTTALNAAKQNDILIIIISSGDRENISSEKAQAVWNIYKKYLPKNIIIAISTSSPVLTIYQIVDILNNGIFTPTTKVLAPTPEAKRLADTLIQQGGPFEINLYASEEDTGRYKAFFDEAKSKIYKGKNVRDIHLKGVLRLASATKAREALTTKNTKQFISMLPDMREEDRISIVRLLS
jgi:cytidyltransferase-like protein